MDFLLSLSSLVLLETFKLCVITVMSSLIKVYTLHVKCRYRYFIQILTSSLADGKKIC